MLVKRDIDALAIEVVDEPEQLASAPLKKKAPRRR